jgi:hypothetical protein
VCRDCAKLGTEEIAYRQHVRDIGRLLSADGFVRRTQRRTFEKYLVHPDARVRGYAEWIKLIQEEQRRVDAALRAADEADEEAAFGGVEANDMPGGDEAGSPSEDDACFPADRDEEGVLIDEEGCLFPDEAFSRCDVAQLLGVVGVEHTEEIMTAGEQLIERGVERGRKAEQERSVLRLLRARFGALSDAAAARIHAADRARLDTWFDRALTAATLDDVLDGV